MIDYLILALLACIAIPAIIMDARSATKAALRRAFEEYKP